MFSSAVAERQPPPETIELDAQSLLLENVVPVDPKHLESPPTPIPMAPRPDLANRLHHGEMALTLWLMPRQIQLLFKCATKTFAP